MEITEKELEDINNMLVEINNLIDAEMFRFNDKVNDCQRILTRGEYIRYALTKIAQRAKGHPS